MDQVSPPMRIALVAAILFALLWLAVLKPKPGGDSSASQPIATPANASSAGTANGQQAQTGLGQATQAARGAAQTQQQADTASGAASDAAGSASATAAPSTPAGTATAAPAAAATTAPSAAPAPAATAQAATPATVARGNGLPRPVAAAIADRQVVVLLFADKGSMGDRQARRAINGIGRRGRVYARTVPVGRVASYAAITQGVDVTDAPSFVVVDRDRKARLLSGYVARDTLRQAVADARRS